MNVRFYLSYDIILILFDLILYVPSTIFQLNRDMSSWVEPVLSYDKCVLLKNHKPVKIIRNRIFGVKNVRILSYA